MKRWDSGSSATSAVSASLEMTPEIGGDDNGDDDNGDVEALCRGGPRTRLSVWLKKWSGPRMSGHDKSAIFG